MIGLMGEGPSLYALAIVLFLLAWRLLPLLLQRLRGKREAEGYEKVAAALERNTRAVEEMTRLIQGVADMVGARRDGAAAGAAANGERDLEASRPSPADG